MMNRFIATLALLGILALTGCPGGAKSIRSAKEQSAKLKIYGRNIIRANVAGFKAGEISRSDLQVLNLATAKYIGAVAALDEGIKAAELASKAGGAKFDLDALERILNSEVVPAFVEMLGKLKLLPAGGSGIVQQAILGIQLTIAALRTISSEVRTAGGDAHVRSA
jgi:hypothetical protein